MPFRSHRVIAAALTLLATACGGGGDGPSSGAGGSSGHGGGSMGSGAPPGSDACVRYDYYVSACDGMPLPPGTHVSTGGCSARDACIANCGIDTPCDVLTDGASHRDGFKQYQACVGSCYENGSSSGGSSSGGMGGSSSTQSGGSMSGGHGSTSHSASSANSTGTSGGSCPFSPGSIDCNGACTHYMSYCSACGGCQFSTKDNCIADCEYEVGATTSTEYSCMILTWGCYDQSSSCNAFTDCFLQNHCPEYPGSC